MGVIADWLAKEKKLKAANVKFEFHRYDAGHAELRKSRADSAQQQTHGAAATDDKPCDQRFGTHERGSNREIHNPSRIHRN